MYAHTLLNPSRADAIKIFDCPPLPQKFETTNERALLQGVMVFPPPTVPPKFAGSFRVWESKFSWAIEEIFY